VITSVLYRQGVRTDEPVDPSAAGEAAEGDGVLVWLDVEDPSDDELSMLAKEFHLHPLVIEDARHRRQRPKVELFEGYVFVVLQAAGPDAQTVVTGDDFQGSEIHAFAGDGFLVTMRYAPAFEMAPVLERWESQPERLCLGAGYALYTLIDVIVDRFLSTVEGFEDMADQLEDDVFAPESVAGETGNVRERLFRLKRETVRMRRWVSPLREGIELIFGRPELMKPELEPYYRDVVDHVIRCDELLDNVRDLFTSLQEIRIGQAANRMNEVMKSLTAWATIVLVPTLLAGIWGMNFRHMPELEWRYGYLVALGTIVGSAIGLFIWFKWKKRWL
jgi:magnesium transporter